MVSVRLSTTMKERQVVTVYRHPVLCLGMTFETRLCLSLDLTLSLVRATRQFRFDCCSCLVLSRRLTCLSLSEIKLRDNL